MGLGGAEHDAPARRVARGHRGLELHEGPDVLVVLAVACEAPHASRLELVQRDQRFCTLPGEMMASTVILIDVPSRHRALTQPRKRGGQFQGQRLGAKKRKLCPTRIPPAE